jgi:hypothetical protein
LDLLYIKYSFIRYAYRRIKNAYRKTYQSKKKSTASSLVFCVWTWRLNLTVRIQANIVLEKETQTLCMCVCVYYASIELYELNSVALVRKRTIPTERPSYVGEVCQLLWTEGAAWSAQRIPMAVNLRFSRPGAATFPFE